MYARWTFKFEEAWGWIHQAGLTQGTTQPSQPYEDNNDFSVWEHPIDIHFKTTTLQKWPQLVLKIFHRSVYVQRDEFCAYAVCSLPTHAGHHQISCSAWQPMDERCALSEELGGLWTGLYPQCVNDAPKEIVERPGWEYSSVQTKGVGRVHFRLFVVTKGMEDLSAVAQATRGLTTEKGSDEQGRMSYREVSLSTHQEEARNSPERSSVHMSRASRLRQTSMASSAGSDGGMRTNTASRQSSRDGSFHGDSVATGIRTAAADSTPPRRHRRGAAAAAGELLSLPPATTQTAHRCLKQLKWQCRDTIARLTDADRTALFDCTGRILRLIEDDSAAHCMVAQVNGQSHNHGPVHPPAEDPASRARTGTWSCGWDNPREATTGNGPNAGTGSGASSRSRSRSSPGPVGACAPFTLTSADYKKLVEAIAALTEAAPGNYTTPPELLSSTDASTHRWGNTSCRTYIKSYQGSKGHLDACGRPVNSPMYYASNRVYGAQLDLLAAKPIDDNTTLPASRPSHTQKARLA
eukprot:jgi/Tetstr1/437796/TSEL_002835.t1